MQVFPIAAIRCAEALLGACAGRFRARLMESAGAERRSAGALWWRGIFVAVNYSDVVFHVVINCSAIVCHVIKMVELGKVDI